MDVRVDGIADASAAEGARAVARALLEAAREAAVRLTDPDDVDALHDFRVGVRRMRSWLRAFRRAAGGIRRKRVRALGELAHASNAARDAEVHRATLASHAARIPADHRPAAEWMRERIARGAGDPAALRTELVLRFARIAGKLDVALAGPDAPEARFGDAAAAVLRDQMSRVHRALRRVRSPDDARRAHRARIEAKRLRYLLEPLRASAPAARDAVQRLKGLQDVLGALHDAHVLEAVLEDSAQDAEAAGHQPGLARLRSVVAAERDARFAALADGWLDRRDAALVMAVEEVASALTRPAAEGAQATPRTNGAGAAPSERTDGHGQAPA